MWVWLQVCSTTDKTIYFLTSITWLKWPQHILTPISRENYEKHHFTFDKSVTLCVLLYRQTKGCSTFQQKNLSWCKKYEKSSSYTVNRFGCKSRALQNNYFLGQWPVILNRVNYEHKGLKKRQYWITSQHYRKPVPELSGS